MDTASEQVAQLPGETPIEAYLRTCPSRNVLEVLANKWAILIMGALRAGPQRFGALRRRLAGVTQKSLTAALRSLERDGLITRTQYPTIPPRVDYALTDLGHRAGELLDTMKVWAEHNLDEVVAARAAYDARPSSASLVPAPEAT